jgi:hypothetical protein
MKTRTSPKNKTSGYPARFFGAALTLALMAPASSSSQPQEKVNLGSTAKFAVLAGSLVSNVPGSAITGDVGLSPSAGSKITGFGSGEITGTVYTVDQTGPAGSVPAASELTTAKGDLTIAYNDAAGRTPVPSGPFLNAGAGNIGGMTLIAGLYKFTSSLAITGSDLTLSGGANDVWIFQVASDLNVANGIKVILAGGARAANIFWQIGTSATLGTTSVFKGTIMADQSISLNTGATLEGRALASSAAVTLASSAVTRPVSPASVSGRSGTGGFALYQDRARPSGGAFDIVFIVPADGVAKLTVMDSQGREVASPFNGRAEAGRANRIRVGAGASSEGLLFSKLEFNGRVCAAKMLIVD